jgi:RNA polymerase sigma-70 factor (ECF subfamily)
VSRPAAPPRPDADALYRALRAPVLALCLRLTGSRADAEDALQDVFTSVHRALPAFRGEARPATWIYRIAIRAALRIRARRRETVPLDPERDGSARPEDVLAARDEVRRVAAAFDRLSADHRTVLSLFALDGLSHRELAEILGVPEGTVWSRLHAARTRLAEEVSRRG